MDQGGRERAALDAAVRGWAISGIGDRTREAAMAADVPSIPAEGSPVSLTRER
jgi:hypothetical protein